MKKILKRLGIFGLLLAVLIPFLDLPVVNAATDGGCTTGMNVYFFLDKFTGAEADPSDGVYSGAGHRNYAKFDYAMPINATITDVKPVSLKSETAQEDFYTIYNEVYGSNDLTKSNKKYEEVIKTNGINLSFNTNSKYDDGITYIIHGQWAEVSVDDDDESGYTILNSEGRAKLSGEGGLFTDSDDFKDSLIQTYIDEDNLETEIGLGYLTGDEQMAKIPGVSYGNTNFLEAFNTNISNKYEEAVSKGYIVEKNGNVPKVIVGITRKISSDAVSTMDDAGTYYWPAAYQVTYEVCNTTTDKVNLTYNGNTDDATLDKVPATQSYGINEEVTVQAGASRDNYAFKKWCTEKDGTGTCYVEDDTFNITTDTTLYAQWGKEGTTPVSPTGIASYIIGFASVGIVASGIYLISKKKNLFKQI